MTDAIKIFQELAPRIDDLQSTLMDDEKVLIRVTKTGTEVEVFHSLPGNGMETLTYQIGEMW